MRKFNLYNTLSRSIEEFVPLVSGKASIYTCGPTVYNFAHIGNMRTYIGEDVLVRTLEAFGYDVNRVMNITDVGHLESDADDGEDKLLKGAIRENKSVYEIAEFYTKAFFDDCAKLRIKAPNTAIRATDMIDRYIAFVQELERKGFTYFANGNVYFDIAKFPAYTKLSRLNLDDLLVGAREDVGVDHSKRNPQDFVLWFTRSKFENQAMKWDSPWGVGYPGWHLECSVIAMETLGPKLDIHCGGVDHINIHHTNEVAQSECYTGDKWVNYWWHAEFLIDETGKMSKSKGEFVNVELLEKKGYDPLAYRFYCLGSHYRKQLVFSFENLDQSVIAFKKLRKRVSELVSEFSSVDGGDAACSPSGAVGKDAVSAKCPTTADLSEAERSGLIGVYALGGEAAECLERFYDALADDLNTANALTEVYAVLKSRSTAEEKMAALLAMENVLQIGLFEGADDTEDAQDAAEGMTAEEIAEIDAKIAERAQAKRDKRYAVADAIRDELAGRGIELVDTPQGTTWKKKC